MPGIGSMIDVKVASRLDVMKGREAPGCRVLRTSSDRDFPNFHPITLDSRSIIESFTSGLEPYADFNFLELWAWNQSESSGYSILNGNLVVLWEDVVTHELFLTFLGTNAVIETAETLIDYAMYSGITPRLFAVPEVVIQQVPDFGPTLRVDFDPVNSDYLLSTELWSTLPGAPFKNKRNAIHRLERNHNPKVNRLDLSNERVRADIRSTCAVWASLRSRVPEATQGEFQAIEQVLAFAEKHSGNAIYAIGVYVDGCMIGFSINEELRDGFGLGHFAKADFRFDGIYPYMLRHVARHMASRGIGLLNIEADLGDPGLIISKRLCHPVGMLKKYAISRVSDD